MTDRVLELLRSRPELAALAEFPFNFDIGRAYHVEEVHLASGASLEAIAGDDTGGTYFLCGGTAVLHASSDGYASLLADSVGEALEMLVRLPAWCEDITYGMDEQALLAAVREGDDEAREQFAPDLDAQRAALIHGLGLPDRPLADLLARSESATRRTDPNYVLLNSAELRAYQLEESYRPDLRALVGEPGQGGEDPPAEALGGLPPESPFTWIERARRQGHVEHARIALIRMLDEAGPAREPLRRIAEALEGVGDHAQAARARSYLGSPGGARPAEPSGSA
ncbi:hypothetical protein [Streptomyces sp. NPDC047981]|uniref:hypothetical protein n=1 Tax=Streptomyces sp. NPDC047981 TaxID=3154610 RepID=UPI003448FEBC